jgi:hypothetical protein
MVAAINSYLYFPETKSAALRKTAARSAKGRVSQSRLAERAEVMAVVTSEALATEPIARASPCEEGMHCSCVWEVVMTELLIWRGRERGAF